MSNALGVGTVRLKRTSQYINRMRKFAIFIDNKHVNDISDGEEIEIPIETGHHELHLKIDWVKSEKYEINVNSGEVVHLLCGLPLKGAKLFIPFIPIIASFVPKWYLFIKEIKDNHK